ncbi:3-deoxy-D-manno-octulosonic acid transferase [Vibrio crassostreae 9CS106]|nr:3-deoxy-D-manno-octulosonic acid transferase [Vibrio crassostreae 9CS106]
MSRFLYTFMLLVSSPILLWGLYRKRPNKLGFDKRWKEHFGYTPTLNNRKTGVIWIHAVSVGEVLASKRLIQQLQQIFPQKVILVTTTTSTGAEQVARLEGIEHRYMPIDFSWCVKGFLKKVRPDVMFIIETELWPNTIHQVNALNIPIVLVNGRLSEKSCNNYQKLLVLIQPMLNKLSTILTVHKDDTERFISLGAEPNKVVTTGSIKYDLTIDEDIVQQGLALRKQLGTMRPVFVAASTHNGEDEKILAAYQLAKKTLSGLLLILIPRHPERFDEVGKLVTQSGLVYFKRTELGTHPLAEYADVYLADTIGEMLILMSASDLVFMGGSLLGSKVGGHNFIEPVTLCKPCLTGPSYYNFSDVASQLISLGALRVISSEDELSIEINDFFENGSVFMKRAEIGANSLIKNQGALTKTIDICMRYIV